MQNRRPPAAAVTPAFGEPVIMKTRSVLGIAITLAPAFACLGSVPRPEPVSFHCRGFSLVAEIFPPKSRQNPSDGPLCYFYSVGYPGTTWKVDAKLLWKAQLVQVPPPHAGPYQAVVSRRGHLVTMNGGVGTYQKHSVAIYSPEGKLVKSYPFKSLTPLVERVGRLPMWGWHRGARYFFPRKAPLFYILFPWGKAMEFGLKDGAFKHGEAKDFPELAALAGKQYVDEEAKIWSTSLRFSSLTDVIQARPLPTTRPATATTRPAARAIRFEPSSGYSVAYVGGEWLVIYLVADETAVRLEIPLGAKRVEGNLSVSVAPGKARATLALARGKDVWKYFRPGAVPPAPVPAPAPPPLPTPGPPSPPPYREEPAASGSFTCVGVPARKTWPYHGKTKTIVKDVQLTFPSGRVTVAGPLTFVLKPFPP